MILWDKILSDLIGVVGWKQSTVTGSVVIDAANLATSSGLYVQGAHPSCTVKNIKATQEDTAISDVNMNAVLVDIMKNGIINVLNAVFPSRDIYANDLLYKYESDFNHPITTRTGFVGFEISIANRNDVVSILNKVILQFNGAGNVKLLLFNSGVKLPITSKTITVTADTNITSVLDWVLGYITAPGGEYYLGYLNTSLGFSAYDRQFNLANVMTEFNSIMFTPIYVDGWNVETLFDIEDVVYTSESFGINLDITTAKDYSNIILQNKDKFAKAIQLAAATEAIAMMTSTSRINPEERVIMNVFGQKIVIDSPQTYNLYSNLEKEIKSLTVLFSENAISKGTLR